MNVAIRVDANPQVGLGHLRRCLTLAQQLRELGCTVRFLCGAPCEDGVRRLIEGFDVTEIQSTTDTDFELSDAAATVATVGSPRSGESWVVVDSYALACRWEQRVRSAGHRVLVIDDFRHRRHHADLLLSDSEAAFDPGLNEQDGKALFGRKYALIDRAYAYSAAAPRSAPWHLLLSYGGADETAETPKALQAIAALEARHLVGRIDVAVGIFNRRATEISDTARALAGARVHLAPNGLASLMREADLVLTAGGNSLVEALSLRKPCLVTVTADNQALMVEQLAAERLVRNLGSQDLVRVNQLGAALSDTLHDLQAFAARVSAQPAFDHLGAYRVATALVRGTI